MPYAEIKDNGGSLLFLSDYSPRLVADLKAQIPAKDRRWDGAARAWVVDAMHGALLARLAKMHLGVSPSVPLVTNASVQVTRLLKLEYLGKCKQREPDGEFNAFGYVDGGWNAVFPERVLTTWFEAPARKEQPGATGTLYAVLSVPHSADATVIKSAYRRLARQWHPDVCKEPDASDVFIRIQHAYEVLSNDLQRRKYNAGLAFEASAHKQDCAPAYDVLNANGFRAPLRCGYVLATGTFLLGQFIAGEITAWEDLVDARGRIAVSSWPKGADMFVTRWVEP